MSTFHWFPIVNGYSGVYPPSYLARRDRLEHFPDQASLRNFARTGCRYVVLPRRTVRVGRALGDSDATGIAHLVRFLELGSVW